MYGTTVVNQAYFYGSYSTFYNENKLIANYLLLGPGFALCEVATIGTISANQLEVQTALLIVSGNITSAQPIAFTGQYTELRT